MYYILCREIREIREISKIGKIKAGIRIKGRNWQLGNLAMQLGNVI